MATKVFNVVVTARNGESTDKLIKRFFKKCKKQEITKEHYDKVCYAKTKSQKKKEKILKNARLRALSKYKFENRMNNRNNSKFR